MPDLVLEYIVSGQVMAGIVPKDGIWASKMGLEFEWPSSRVCKWFGLNGL
jgi:hypothetical protein